VVIRGKIRFPAGGLILLASLVFSAMSVPVFALDKKPDPSNTAVKFKHHFPTHMTLEEAAQYERRVGDGPEFAEMAQSEASFVPGTPAAQSALQGPSGLFNGIFSGNTMYDCQHYGASHRMIETGISAYDGVRYTHVTWTCLKVDTAYSRTRQVNYNCYDWTDGPNGGWCLGDDSWGGNRITDVGPPECAGWSCLDVNTAGNAVVFYHSDVFDCCEWITVVRFDIPCWGTFSARPLPNLLGGHSMYPRGEVGHSTDENGDIYHVVGGDSYDDERDVRLKLYWRRVYSEGSYVWQGPVRIDSAKAYTYSHLVLADGQRVIFTFARPRNYGPEHNEYNNDLVYYESDYRR